jgi:fatty acid desaturase
MLGSMHAIRWNHLRHHKLCMSEDDVEAMSARMPAWKALLIGPSFPWHLHRTALRLANRRERRWILAELACGAAIVCTAFGQTDWGWLRYHVIAMATGHCLTAFFAVWTVHHDCDTDVIARTIRRAVLSRASYTMFYHVEHHLFPRVPTRRLPALAMRIERMAPDLCSKRVL